MMKVSKFVSVLVLLCFNYLVSLPIAYGAEENSPRCQRLLEKIQWISKNIAWVYEADSAMYGAFSNVLIIDNLPEESSMVQKRLGEVFNVVQKNQLELQNIYALMCSNKAEDDESE